MLNQRYLLEICLGATDLKFNEDLSVSVVVPFYNRSRFLKRLLDSVAAQTLAADKVYIIDNGSNLEETIKAWEIITTHKLVDKCVFTSSIGEGNANFARNLGYELAKTKYVAFLDSDDWWEPEHIANSLEVLQESNKAGVYSSAIIHSHKGTTIAKSIDVNLFDTPFELLFGPYIAQTSSYIVNKRQLKNIVMWDNELKRHQDFDYFASIFYQSSGWCFNSDSNVNIDRLIGGTAVKDIDFQSLILFYKKWKSSIPKTIKYEYLSIMLYICYTHNAKTKFKSFYRNELSNEGFLNSRKNKIKASGFYLTFYINLALFLDKLKVKEIVKRLVLHNAS